MIDPAPTTMRYVRSDAVIEQAHGPDLLILPIARSRVDLERVFVLNETAACVWEQLRRPATKARLAEVVLEHFAVERPTAVRDVDVLLDALLRHGLAMRAAETESETAAERSRPPEEKTP